jgi:Na+/melibiose symporter-like transporter
MLEIVNKVLGGTVGTILDKIFPDKNEKLKFEMELRQEMTKHLELHLKDLESARNLQVEALRQNDNFSKRFIYYLTYGLIINALVAGILSFFVDFPPQNNDLVIMYYSFTFITAGGQIMRFFYGTTENVKQSILSK